MTGFIRSLMLRGAGPSLATGAQFATVPQRPRFAATPSGGASVPDPAPGNATAGPARPRFRETGQGANALSVREGKSSSGGDALPAGRSFDVRKSANFPTPVPETNEPFAATRAAVPPPGERHLHLTVPATPLLHDDGTDMDGRQAYDDRTRKASDSHETTAAVGVQSVDRAEDRPSSRVRQPMAQPTSFASQPAPGAPDSRAFGPTIEIGRIEIVIAPPPSPARQEPERTRGFAAYEQRRLGPRR